MKKFAIFALVTLLLCCTVLSLCSCNKNQVTISIGEKSFVVELADTKAAKEFEKALPLTLKMTSNNNRELYRDVDGVTFTSTPDVGGSGILDMGDVMLRGENRLVLFYSMDNSNESLTRIGKIREEDRAAFANAVVQALQASSSKSVTVRISK